MPRKVKTIPLENTLNDSDEEPLDVKVDTYDTVINLIQSENKCDNEDTPPPIVEKVKKVRASRKKKEVEPPIAVSEDEELEEIVVVEDPKVVEDKKKDENIKVVELLQCEKCGKKLTARNIKVFT